MKLWVTVFALLVTLGVVACGGQSTGLSPGVPGPTSRSFSGIALTQIATPAPSPTTLILRQGGVLGADNRFTPTDGDTGKGGTGQRVDGISCGPFAGTYHIHSHLSLLVNGVRIAIPDTIGMKNPGAEVNGFTTNASCFYAIHTHDADGYIHVENAAPANFTLGNLFDIWGRPLSTFDVAGFTGSVRVFVAQAPPHNAIASNYIERTGDPRVIVFSSHEEIAVEVGPTFVTPPKLPPVKFYTEF
jgi:hypothetical protein